MVIDYLGATALVLSISVAVRAWLKFAVDCVLPDDSLDLGIYGGFGFGQVIRILRAVLLRVQVELL
jgi:hypothetical protein